MSFRTRLVFGAERVHSNVKPVEMGTSSDGAAARLHELLGYVEQVVKLDERPVFKLAEYRLANGQIVSSFTSTNFMPCRASSTTKLMMTVRCG